MSDFETPDLTPTNDSMVLDTELGTGAAGGGAVRDLTEPAEPESLRDTLSNALNEAKAKEEEATPTDAEEGEEKPDKELEAKEEPKEKPKREKVEKELVEKATEEPTEEAPKEEQRGSRKAAPEHFLPDSKAVYDNTPRAVRREIESMSQQLKQARGQTQRYSELQPYDDFARQHNRDLKDTLDAVLRIEQTTAQSPLAGLEMFIQEALPSKPNGQPFSLVEIAHIIMQSDPNQINQQIQQAMPRQPAPQEIEMQRIEQQRQDLESRLMVAEVINPFKAENPRYDELEPTIAQFLQSGMIPSNLSHLDKLQAAYDMADRLVPASNLPSDDSESPNKAGRAKNGNKSIKSSLGSVSDRGVQGTKPPSIREALSGAFREINLGR